MLTRVKKNQYNGIYYTNDESELCFLCCKDCMDEFYITCACYDYEQVGRIRYVYEVFMLQVDKIIDKIMGR